MIEVETLRNFISGNFKTAVISGKLVRDKVVLDLNLRNSENKKNDGMHIYTENLEEIRNNPSELLNYLFNDYLENNTIIGARYFTNLHNHSDKTAYVISGVNNSFIIALRQDCANLLPDKFIEKVEKAKKKGILKVLNDIDINKIILHNFDQCDIGRDYRTGLRHDTILNGVYHYDALRVWDYRGKPMNYDGEKEFVFKILELLCEKEKVDYEKMKACIDTFKSGYYNRLYDYKLNDKISVNGYMNEDLFVLLEFLDNYMKDYKDEVKDNQMKLVLKREGE